MSLTSYQAAPPRDAIMSARRRKSNRKDFHPSRLCGKVL